MRIGLHLIGRQVALVAAFGLLAGCGQAPTAKLVGTATRSLSAEMAAENLDGRPFPPPPTPDQFQTIQATVVQILPEDTSGIPHQNFVVKETAPDAGMTLSVNNDTRYGSKVQGLHVGEQLTIKGIEYHDPGKDGIHWTHKISQPGDGGYIKTPDGTVYQ